ncbi:E3 SUMO-protein ligase SIZ1-like [Amaranthus tricolor]|uniref:E3 SUMO-protein ligase SIZ1-like n=1 Tax=Amaranthus tricolor TaxID=29722 RepID=UPI00258F3725|nr:E3 SUMO-protein ligase SIZ1-like [Amaranthus tricolor]XP_057523518.1 E3 SUMO-protein ligase SIZ1-like [Amaranthus tricolor]
MEMDEDLINACKEKLFQFRIKELKEVLTQVGLPKQGKKQDLTDRIVALLYDEGTPGLFKNNVNGKEKLVELINDAYRMLQESGMNGSSSKKPNSSGSSKVQPKEEAEESCELDRKIRCPCGCDVLCGARPLVQCVDPDCNVWQHTDCVIIPEKPTEKISMPTRFLCDLCRVKRADPFWETLAHPLYPVKLAPSNLPVDGTHPHQAVEKTFKLTRVDRDLLLKTEYDIQAWCMLFNDGVPFRMHWPLHAALLINGVPVRAVSRAASQLLGANGRDDGAKITMYIVEGPNKISLSCIDSRSFCFGIRLVRRRTFEQVRSMIPKESDGEPFVDALARVQRCIGGGATTGNDDYDSDLEVIADSITVNLRCPMSGSRMKTAGRFRACAHMGCFDLETFVGLNERSRKWQCPICLRNYSLEDVIVDPFFNLILKKMQSCGEEIYEIDLKPDGSWRVRNVRDVGDLAQWHCSDGSVQFSSFPQPTRESALEGNVSKVGMQNNFCNAHIDGQGNEVENFDQNIITMSSTTTGDVKDEEDPSINQDGAEQFGASDMNEPEISSALPNMGQTYESNHQNADVIVLSDSEDDVSLVYPETTPVVDHEGYSISAPEKKLSSSPAIASEEDPGVFNGSAGGFPISHPSTLLNPQVDPQFNCFGTSDALLDEHNTAFYSGSVNCMLTTGSSVDPVHHMMNSYDHRNTSFDHQFESANGNIALELLVSCPTVSGNELQLLNNNPSEDWISSKTGTNGNESSSSNVEAHVDTTGEIGMDVQTQFTSEDSLLQSTPGDCGPGPGSETDHTANRKRSGAPFIFPRKQRSLRRRQLLIRPSKNVVFRGS